MQGNHRTRAQRSVRWRKGWGEERENKRKEEAEEDKIPRRKVGPGWMDGQTDIGRWRGWGWGGQRVGTW